MKIRFPYSPDRRALLEKMRLPAASDEAGAFLRLLERLAPLADPQAAFLESGVSFAVPEPDVEIGGTTFRGSLLRAQLRGAAAAWPFLTTCGREVHNAAEKIDDFLERFWADAILEDALDAATRGFDEYFRASVHSGKTTTLMPGSFDGWPLEQQKPLFELLKDAAALCGVTLTDSMTMIPAKTLSGIRFPGGSGPFCGRERCEGRLCRRCGNF